MRLGAATAAMAVIVRACTRPLLAPRVRHTARGNSRGAAGRAQVADRLGDSFLAAADALAGLRYASRKSVPELIRALGEDDAGVRAAAALGSLSGEYFEGALSRPASMAASGRVTSCTSLAK